MSLNHVVIGEGEKSIFILHGIFGSLRNWRSFGLQLSKSCPGYRVIIIDLRCHGDSHGFQPPHIIANCVKDLQQLQATVGKPQVVIGHSFGGKVALLYAQAAMISQIWSLDSPPFYDGDTGDTNEANLVVEALENVPQPLANRRDLVDILLQKGFSKAIAQWMTTNLKPTADGFRWRFDLAGIKSLLKDYFQHDVWPVVENPPHKMDVHLVRGMRSDRWSPTAIHRLQQLQQATVHELPNAGHWVHADNPQGLLSIFQQYL